MSAPEPTPWGDYAFEEPASSGGGSGQEPEQPEASKTRWTRLKEAIVE